MKLKMLAAFAAAAVLAGGLASCGSGDDESKSEKKAGASTAGGKYVRIYGAGLYALQWKEDIDGYIKNNSTASSESYFVELNGGKAVIRFPIQEVEREMHGSYKQNGDVLEFEYSELTDYKDGEVIHELSINDEGDSRSEKNAIKSMKSFNESGCFPLDINEAGSGLGNGYNTLPNVTHRAVNSSYKIKTEPSCDFKCEGDMLCIDVYGFELDGSYSSGKDFQVRQNWLRCMNDDPMGNSDISAGDRTFKAIGDAIGVEDASDAGDYDCTIEFSDGRWEWYNSRNELINNGIYEESQEHTGLIAMYLTADSKNQQKDRSYMPLTFYINGDDIYYPEYVKIN